MTTRPGEGIHDIIFGPTQHVDMETELGVIKGDRQLREVHLYFSEVFSTQCLPVLQAYSESAAQKLVVNLSSRHICREFLSHEVVRQAITDIHIYADVDDGSPLDLSGLGRLEALRSAKFDGHQEFLSALAGVRLSQSCQALDLSLMFIEGTTEANHLVHFLQQNPQIEELSLNAASAEVVKIFAAHLQRRHTLKTLSWRFYCMGPHRFFKQKAVMDVLATLNITEGLCLKLEPDLRSVAAVKSIAANMHGGRCLTIRLDLEAIFAERPEEVQCTLSSFFDASIGGDSKLLRFRLVMTHPRPNVSDSMAFSSVLPNLSPCLEKLVIDTYFRDGMIGQHSGNIPQLPHLK